MKRALATLSALGLLISAVWAAEPTDKSKAEESAKKKPAKEEKEKELSPADKMLVEHAKKTSSKLTEAQKTKLLEVLNTGEDAAVNDLPGVGPIKAMHIKKARPLKSLEDLILVEGIGEKTFDEIVKSTAAAAKKADTTKPDPKKH